MKETPIKETTSNGDNGRTGSAITKYYEINCKGLGMVNVVADAGDDTAFMFVNDQLYKKAQYYELSANKYLLFDENGNRMVRVIVQSGNKEPIIYVVKVTGGDPNAAKVNTDLESIVIFPGETRLMKDNGVYRATVSNVVEAVSFMANAFNPYAQKVELTSGEVGVDDASENWIVLERDERNETAFPLNEGANTFTARVTAEDGTTKAVHKIIITREEQTADGITVTFSVMGENVLFTKTVAVDGSTTWTPIPGAARNPHPWVEQTNISGLTAGTSVKTITDTILQNLGYTLHLKSKGSYLAGITNPEGVELSEFTNGQNSGWMFKYNGRIGNLGYAQQVVVDGATIEWFYTNDYTQVPDANWTDTESAEYKAFEALQNAFNALNTLISTVERSQYSAEELAALSTVLSDARTINLNPDSALTDIQNATTALQEAFDALEGDTEVDKTDLTALINTAKELIESDYTEESWSALQTAISTAETVAADDEATQEDVDAQVTALQDAIGALEEKAAPTNYATIKNETLKYLFDETPDPMFDSIGGEWVVLSLARGGFTDSGYNSWVNKYLTELNKTVSGKTPKPNVVLGTNRTDNARVTLALSALGYDAENWNDYNLLSALTDTAAVSAQGINGPIWALIALDSGDYLKNTTLREDYVDLILKGRDSNQTTWTHNGMSVYDMTAMAIQALVPYYNKSEVKTAVDDALAWLENNQTALVANSSEAIVQYIVALTSMGYDPTSHTGRNLIDDLLAYRITSGVGEYSFKHDMSENPLDESAINWMATEQAAYALVAYDRFVNQQTRLYDMSDAVMDKTTLNEKITMAKALNENSYTPTSWTEAKLGEAISAAETVAAKSGATRAEITAAIDALNEAISKLELKADKAALDAKIAAVSGLTESDYTSDSWKAFSDALDDAKNVSQNSSATSTDVSDALSALTTAHSGLVSLVDLKAKIAEVQAANLIESEYNPISWASLQGALTAANSVITTADATKAEVAAALENLSSAYENLEKSADKTVLNNAIATAESMNKDDYTLDSWKTMQAVLADAKNVADDPYSSQELVNATAAELENAITELVDYTVPETPSVVPADNTVTAAVTATGDTATVEKEAIETALANAFDGLSSGQIAEIKVEVTGTSTEVAITKMLSDVVDAIIEAAKDEDADIQLKTDTPAGTLTFDSDVLQTIATEAANNGGSAEISIEIRKVDNSTLDAAQKEKVGDNPVFELTLKVGDTPVSQLGGTVVVTIPYTLPEDVRVGDLEVYHLASDGTLTKIDKFSYDEVNKTITFTTTHVVKVNRRKLLKRLNQKVTQSDNLLHSGVARTQ